MKWSDSELVVPPGRSGLTSKYTYMESLRLILSNRTYFAPAWVFASLNIVTGTWVLYLPYVKTKLELNDAQIGVALFFLALGLLLSIPFIPIVNRKIGVGNSTILGIVLFALSYNLPIIAPTYWLLCASLLMTGVFSGYTDIAMNALVSTIEETHEQNFMSAAHGFFSLGGFIGASIGSVLISIFSSPSWHMLTVTLFIIGTNVWLAKHYKSIKEKVIPKTEHGNKFKSIRLLLALSIIAFIIMFNEGAVEHWSNLFFFDIVKVAESKAGFGFIAFSLCMTIGRFLGDGISEKFGTVNTIGYGCLIAFGAYFFIISSNLYLAVLGFGILGLGLSVIIPELFRLAGRTKEVPASIGISIVSGIGFTGFMIGPVLLGFISNWTNLIWSFGFLAFSVVVALGLTFLQLRRTYKSV